MPKSFKRSPAHRWLIMRCSMFTNSHGFWCNGKWALQVVSEPGFGLVMGSNLPDAIPTRVSTWYCSTNGIRRQKLFQGLHRKMEWLNA